MRVESGFRRLLAALRPNGMMLLTEGEMRDERSKAKAVPYFFPTSLLALIPGLFAWQVHGFWTGLFVWCAVAILVIGLGWLFLLRQWSYRWLTPARSALI